MKLDWGQGRAFLGKKKKIKIKLLKIIIRKNEASSLDRIKMTKTRLEFDRKNVKPMNVNIGT